MTDQGHPEIWMDGFVCPKRQCSGYATLEHNGTGVRRPALNDGPTLGDAWVHAHIKGALKFRDAQKT
jgi:hypothetical protein